MKSGSKAPRYAWDITVGTYPTRTVFAKTFGAAVRKVARSIGVTLITDHNTGGWLNAFGEVRK